MLQPLDREDDAEGQQCEGGGPDAKVAKPYRRVVNDLYCELGGKVGDNESEQGLEAREHTC